MSTWTYPYYEKLDVRSAIDWVFNVSQTLSLNTTYVCMAKVRDGEVTAISLCFYSFKISLLWERTIVDKMDVQGIGAIFKGVIGCIHVIKEGEKDEESRIFLALLPAITLTFVNGNRLYVRA